jgi:hypothetical protein
MAGATLARSAFTALHAHPTAEEVRNQMALVLASPLFRNSRHYPALLRYIVEETLDGKHGHLKERSLGVVVFGREPNYDTNLDPVVRTSACEVRKRLAQYYHEHEHDATVRIDVPHGSYVPEFRYRNPSIVAPPAPAIAPATVQGGVPWNFNPRVWGRIHYAAVVAIALASIAGVVLLRTNRTATDRFWSPVWGSADSIMISLGQSPSAAANSPDPEKPPTVWDVMAGDRVEFADAVTMGRVTGLLREHGREFDIRKASDFTLTDFRNGPVVLIGAFNNDWTLRLENQLRFVFEGDPVTKSANIIKDRQNPSRTSWRIDNAAEYSKVTADYAIVSRVLDPVTERAVVVIAGLTKDGTTAAGEFATEERYLQALARVAPAGWERKNFQVVISTEIIDGNPGPPRIVATNFW